MDDELTPGTVVKVPDPSWDPDKPKVKGVVRKFLNGQYWVELKHTNGVAYDVKYRRGHIEVVKES